MNELQIMGEKTSFLIFKSRTVVARIRVSNNRLEVIASDQNLGKAIRAAAENAIRRDQVVAEVHKRERREGRTYHIAAYAPIGPSDPRFLQKLGERMCTWPPARIEGRDILWSATVVA